MKTLIYDEVEPVTSSELLEQHKMIAMVTRHPGVDDQTFEAAAIGPHSGKSPLKREIMVQGRPARFVIVLRDNATAPHVAKVESLLDNDPRLRRALE